MNANPANITDPNTYATAATMTGGRKPSPRPTFPVQTTGTRTFRTRRGPIGPDASGYWGSRKVFV